MTAAGVQNIDSAAYLPPPPTSTPDAKGTSAAGQPAVDAKAANAQGAPSDFHNELQLQQTDAQQTGPQRTQSKASPKADPGKSGAKKNVRQDDANLAAVTPVQITEPQKQILPIGLALARQQELAQQELAPQQENTKLDDNATVDAQASSASVVAAAAHLPGIQQPVALEPSAKLRQSVQSLSAPKTQIVASNASPAVAADPGQGPALPLAPVPSVVQDIPVREEGKKEAGKKSEAAAAQDQAVTPGKPGASSENQPLSPADLKLPAIPAEPVAAAPQVSPQTLPQITPQITTVDPAASMASIPSELAFAARVPAAQTKSDQTVAVNPSQSPAVSGSQTAVQIPVRYAATAQIIPSAATTKNELGTQQDGPKQQQEDTKKDADFGDVPVRAGVRTDMVLPQFETVSQPVASSASAAPQQAAPPARAETIIEPPAAPPTSSHDIRVQIPDSKGGSTQVRFVESGGEVRVSVRTADEGLAQNLRTHLNDLTQRLSDGGTPAEIWKPASNAASSQNESQQQFQQDGRGSGGQGSGGQNGQEDRRQKRPAWLDEMEASLHGETN